VFGAAIGMSAGFAHAVLFIASWIGAGYVAWRFSKVIQPEVEQIVGSTELAYFVSLLVVFVAALIVLVMLTNALYRPIRSSPPRPATPKTTNSPELSLMAHPADPRYTPAVSIARRRPNNDLDKFHEECALFGIYGTSDAAAHTALGLHALQHRGQEAAGIVTFDGRQFHDHRAAGLVGDIFGEQSVIARLKGYCAIGHNRYATTGGSSDRNI